MISIDYTLLIQMGFLLVLMIILNLFVFRPMSALLDERARRIKDPGTDAKSMEAEIEKMRLRYEATLNEAKLKAIEERNKLRKEGADKEQEIVKAAYKAAEEMMSDVKARVEKEVSDAREALKVEAVAISAGVAEKLIGRNI